MSAPQTGMTPGPGAGEVDPRTAGCRACRNVSEGVEGSLDADGHRNGHGIGVHGCKVRRLPGRPT